MITLLVTGISLGALFFYPHTAPIPQEPSTPTTPKIRPSVSMPQSSDSTRSNTPLISTSQHPLQPHSLSKTTAMQQSAPKQAEITQSITKEYLYRALLLPNDPGATNNTALLAVKAQAAWDQTTGSSVVVAVIDSGFALLHEDLKDSWLVNQNETGLTQEGGTCWTGTPQEKSTNECDDDENGYVDDYTGWDFYHADNTPQTGTDNPNGMGTAHGTETAGLSGATTNNGIGIASLNWSTKLMPLQALSDDGLGTTSDIVAAIYYAADNGAQVINMSLGGSELDPALQPAIDYALAKNIIIVAAAGNCGTGQEDSCDPARPGAMSYPALNKGVISVGATDDSGVRASFSSYGPRLSMMAPGSGNISSTAWSPTYETNGYATKLYGTSFAAPMVSSAVSLIKSLRPEASTNEVLGLLAGAASKPTGMNNAFFTNQYGHGIINIDSTVRIASTIGADTTTPILYQTGSERAEHIIGTVSRMNSGCSTLNANYCTIRLHDIVNDYVRFLPYQLTDANGNAGWLWPSDSLTNGSVWTLSSQRGPYSSMGYLLTPDKFDY